MDVFIWCQLIWGSISETVNIFWDIFWVLPTVSLHEKRILVIFVKSNFLFLETVQLGRNTFYLRTSYF